MKAIDALQVSLPNQATTTLVATISSDGKARVYDLAQVPRPVPKSKVESIEPVGEYDSNGSRLVCLALVGSDEAEEESSVVGKRKRGEGDQEDDEDEEPDAREEEVVSDKGESSHEA